jgi:N-acetyl-alpha-D-muramate 1-phosphate uridylyltransferase
VKLAGVVLAAGAGTRLRPLTDILPKALCPVNNVALLDHALARIGPYVARSAVNVHHGRDEMERHLAPLGVHVSFEEPEALGTAGALGQLRDWIAGDPTLLTNADAWHAGGLGALVDGWTGESTRLLVVRDPDRGDFGDLRYAGAALLPWRDVRDLDPVPSGLYELSWQALEREGQLELIEADHQFIDCGTPRDYLDANLAASGGESVIGEGAEVEGELVRSVVWPRAHVLADERLVEAVRATDSVTVQT